MNDPEQWIKANALSCERYCAKISPRACVGHQRRVPEGCARCEHRDPDMVVHWRDQAHVRGGLSPSKRSS